MFRTELPLTPHPQQLPLSARILTLGSCFSDSIGSRLLDFKVAALVNPFGTVFNPLSACKLLRAAAGEDTDWQQHVVEARGRWQSYDLHAEVGADNPVELLQRIQTLTREAGVFLATADAVVLTLGTAYAYRLRETDEIISNCHKISAEKFSKELLTADEIIAAVAETHAYLRRINPRLRFILTVSPVRHLKETLVLNSTSKAMLRVACHYLSDLLPDVSYFPAYELLVDDLRDYRFYASDMLHPSEVAENYIWERFTRTYFDATFGRFKKDWEGIRQALNHRPLHAGAPEHRQFLESTLERLRKLSGQADVRMEILHVERELAALPLPPPPPEPEPEEYDDDEERIDIGAMPEEDGESAAVLVGAGAGVLVEPDDEPEEEDAEEISAEFAYEHAYTAALTTETEDEEEAEAATEDESEEEPARKKKRRSRGGAKRTKRKHARLAAEAAALATPVVDASTEEVPAIPSPDLVDEPTPEPASEVVYITENELRRSSVSAPVAEKEQADHAVEPVEAATPATTPEIDENTPPQAEPLTRRSRNKRREPRAERPARPARKPLYAAEESPQPAPEATPAATPEPNTLSVQSEPASALVPVALEPAQPDPVTSPTDLPAAEGGAQLPANAETEVVTPEQAPPARPSRNRRKAPAVPTPPAAEAMVVASETPEIMESAAVSESPEPSAAPATTSPESKKPASKPKSRRRAASPPPEAPAASAAEVAPDPTAAPARKRAPRRAAGEATLPEPETPTAPEAPVLRRARPARKKPAPDASAPEST